MTLTEIRRAAQNGAVPARVHVQVEAATAKTQREGKPYCELALADACDRMTLRVWSDHPAYKSCSAFTTESFVELTGDFRVHPQYGLEAEKWMVRPLSDQEKKELLEGPADLRTKQASDWEFMAQSIGTIVDPRLRALSETFVNKWGDRFRRAAAARKYHHARRGGLVEHTAQMMRLARAIAPLYSQLNIDLLIAGILFHDSGKLWENQFSETGFVMGYDELGELVGHISIGTWRIGRSHFDWARDRQFVVAKACRRKRRSLENVSTALRRCAHTSPAPHWLTSRRQAIGFAC